ncbi:MAG: Rne/Rng family ribonuclease [Planctomycetota bacterium]
MPKKMLISYQPGEECRVAILEDNKLEEYHAERPATANRVGNLYLGKVTNVESNIQAAFIDFGGSENAFLHTSDLHPRFFPGEDEDTSEKIGKKTPRRERPPIQKCLKKGQKIVVQIMKDGVGTKGPACTSYLSIPGRYLVMMPHMDKVGVSRKVEDDETRKKMRAILDQLEMPEGFGFILRTAGFDKTKTELKRDLSYLQRLWKSIEKRQKQNNKPTLLYAESDLLVRALRDLLDKDVDEIIIDSEQGLTRAANFLKVVAPRTAAKILNYNLKTPMFHAYCIEDQVRIMMSREVPLPSGGRLVIDETEAVVAIDVNSGKSRKANDAETNAYQTNVEAVDEICRQMKLRELGGLVINDLIDMNQAKHRKAIEQQFKDRLKGDRAKTTVLPISPFGILELTRQRMRPSAMSQHFKELPPAYGRGYIRKAESVAGEALREVQLVMSHDKVKKVELIVPSRVAGELLSQRRREMTRLELHSDKHIDVRVGDSLGHDRFTIYAYDEMGNDVEIDRLPKPKPPKKLEPWLDSSDEQAWEETDGRGAMLEALEEKVEAHPIEQIEPAADDMEDEDDEQPMKKKRRRRRRRRGKSSEEGAEGGESAAESDGEASESNSDDAEAKPVADEAADESSESGDDGDEESGSKKKRRRRRRGGRGRKKSEDAGDSDESSEPSESGEPKAEGGEAEASESAETSDDEGAPKKKRRRRRRLLSSETETSASDSGDAESKPVRKKTSRRKAPAKGAEPAEAQTAEVKAAKKPRLLYAASRRKLKPSEKAALGDD